MHPKESPTRITGGFSNTHYWNVVFGYSEHHTLRAAQRTLGTLSGETEQHNAEWNECVINFMVH